MPKQKFTVIAIMLLLSVTNYLRIPGHENVRAVLFLSIFAIGALSALLVAEIVRRIKAGNQVS